MRIFLFLWVVLLLSGCASKEPSSIYDLSGGIRVEGRGATDAIAHQDAFRVAVELTAGTLLRREVKIRDEKVTLNEISAFSAAYVDDYKIISREYPSSGVVLTMDVWVKKSALADRLIDSTTAVDQVSINYTSHQYLSLIRTREAGDALLRSVLSDYPEKAFNLSIKSFQTILSPQRMLILKVNFRLSWRREYLAALHEAAELVSANRHAAPCLRRYDYCGHVHFLGMSLKNNEDFFPKYRVLAFDDLVQASLMHTTFFDSNPHLLVSVQSQDGRPIVHSCFSVSSLTETNYHPLRKFVSSHSEKTSIDTTFSIVEAVDINLPYELSPTHKVELKIVPVLECAGPRKPGTGTH